MDTLYRRKWFIIFILSVYRRLDPVEGLKCYCNSQSESCPNETCETDGFCFASTSRRDGRQHYTFQCWGRSSVFPPGDWPIWCRAHEAPEQVFCCATDLCNRAFVAPGTLWAPPPPPSGARCVLRIVPSVHGITWGIHHSTLNGMSNRWARSD